MNIMENYIYLDYRHVVEGISGFEEREESSGYLIPLSDIIKIPKLLEYLKNVPSFKKINADDDYEVESLWIEYVLGFCERDIYEEDEYYLFPPEDFGVHIIKNNEYYKKLESYIQKKELEGYTDKEITEMFEFVNYVHPLLKTYQGTLSKWKVDELKSLPKYVGVIGGIFNIFMYHVAG